MGGVLVDKILLLFAICRCVPDIFAIKVESCQKALWILDVFSPSQILNSNFRGYDSQSYTHFITPASRHVPWEKFCGDTPTILEVIGAHTLNFKPNFKFSRLNFFTGSPLAVVVCACKCWSICKSCKNLMLKCEPAVTLYVYCGYSASLTFLCGHHFHHVTALFATFGVTEQHWPSISRRGSDTSRGGLGWKGAQSIRSGGLTPPPPEPPVTLTTGCGHIRGSVKKFWAWLPSARLLGEKMLLALARVSY